MLYKGSDKEMIEHATKTRNEPEAYNVKYLFVNENTVIQAETMFYSIELD